MIGAHESNTEHDNRCKGKTDECFHSFSTPFLFDFLEPILLHPQRSSSGFYTDYGS
jgi:hypothetical protein